MGRKPRPTAIKKLEGNRGKRPLNDREPEYAIGLLEAPGGLSEVGRAEWLRVGNILCGQRVLTEVDFAVLMTYCWCYQEVTRLQLAFKGGEPMVQTTPNGYEQASAAFSNMRTLTSMMMKAAIELGLTPSSRSKIKVNDEPVGDSMAQLLEG